MTLGKLVFRNITRRRGRFVFTLLGITIGIASFVTFLSLGGSLKAEIHRESAALGANLVVTPKGSCAYEQVSILTGEQLPTTITAAEVAKIRAIQGITAIPYLTERTAVDNRPVTVLGILPDETKSFKGWEVARGAYLDTSTEGQAVVGSVLAAQFGLEPGSFLTIRGERLPVRGVLGETGSKDDLTVFLPPSSPNASTARARWSPLWPCGRRHQRSRATPWKIKRWSASVSSPTSRCSNRSSPSSAP
jgi:putative ABC transport system permease protein